MRKENLSFKRVREINELKCKTFVAVRSPLNIPQYVSFGRSREQSHFLSLLKSKLELPGLDRQDNQARKNLWSTATAGFMVGLIYGTLILIVRVRNETSFFLLY